MRRGSRHDAPPEYFIVAGLLALMYLSNALLKRRTMLSYIPGSAHSMQRRFGQWALALLILLVPLAAQALPSFARQTGQNCVACHAGGQFPELTPYGRLFKLTGYTIGERSTIPLSVMAVASYTKTQNAVSDAPSVDFAKDAVALFQTGSVFVGSKVTDNIGVFVQATYDNYANQNADTLAWSGHSHADNMDFRYAEHFIDANRDLIVGLSVNNNPSVADVWNTAPAWLQYVPTRFGFTGASTGPIVSRLGQQVAGVGAYAFWNRTVYGELAAYQPAKGAFSFLSAGNATSNRLAGSNPYVRLALNHEWGAHNAMIGVFGLNADVYPDPNNPSGPTTRYRDRGIDAQYQYILDPHTVTAQLSYIREKINGGDVTGIASNASNTLNQLKLKGSYIYRAKYGVSLSYFSTTGSSDATLYPGLQDDGTGSGNMIPVSISGNFANNPGTRGWIPEVFWTPVQYARVGIQYFKFDRFNGASSNYDGAGRNAKDNNTLFVYLWAAY
jgi:hypothetical protein